jgi:rubrerythrin
MKQHVKDTTILEAVAGAIQYEKDCFEFYLKVYEQAKEGSPIKEMFQQLAEESDEHIKLIQNIYNELEGGTEFPNLKELAAIHKFHSSAIFKIMRKLERNVKDVSNSDLINAEKAMQAAEDARDFFNKIKEKFTDPEIKILFKRLADFHEENRLLIEGQYNFMSQITHQNFYWEEETK